MKKAIALFLIVAALPLAAQADGIIREGGICWMEMSGGRVPTHCSSREERAAEFERVRRKMLETSSERDYCMAQVGEGMVSYPSDCSAEEMQFPGPSPLGNGYTNSSHSMRSKPLAEVAPEDVWCSYRTSSDSGESYKLSVALSDGRPVDDCRASGHEFHGKAFLYDRHLFWNGSEFVPVVPSE